MIDRKESVFGGLILTDNIEKTKIYWASSHKGTRESFLINQGLVNNARVELVDNEKESDFVFQFYHIGKHNHFYDSTVYPPEKTIIIDYHDNPHWFFPVKHLAYFKRSWVDRVKHESYDTKKLTKKPDNCYPLTLAIIDEFIIKEDLERDIMLSCTLREERHRNRKRVLDFIRRMDIQGNRQIGEFSGGRMGRWNGPEMREYFRHLKRSRIVVTCNPGKWEGDHRTWEAFASGALVFIDKIYTPFVHPLIDSKHCIFYELSDQGLAELEKRILYFIQETDRADEIARAGHEFTMKYHRTSNRIDEILDRIL